MINLEKEIVVRKIAEEIKEVVLDLGYKVEEISFDKNRNEELQIRIVKN
ncbi:MAG: hypothetical protein ACRCZO_06905 [Cetobacterium sp.]